MSDGAYRVVDGDKSRRAGVVDGRLAERLAVEMERADYDEVRLFGFTETCPTAYDGEEIVYTFHLEARDEVIPTCEFVIEWDQEPFVMTLELLEQVDR